MASSAPLVLLHGVPDTPAMWQPLKDALPLRDGPVLAPALPGFTAPVPQGFGCTKDDYAAWFVSELETIAQEHGPVDLVGHDWGALISTRAICLRPDLIKSWALSGAVVQRDYPGHIFAQLWRVPVVGEAMMALTPNSLAAKILARQGMPEDMAKEEAAAGNPVMRRSILKLYRSAGGLATFGTWPDDLNRMPKLGLVLWGGKDPYVPQRYAEAFAAEAGVPFRAAPDAGHWVIAQEPHWFADQLSEFWSEQEAAARCPDRHGRPSF